MERMSTMSKLDLSVMSKFLHYYYMEVLNCTPCTFNNSSLKVLGVAGHMSAHCRAAFSVPFISSVHDVKLSHWFQMLECYI